MEPPRVEPPPQPVSPFDPTPRPPKKGGCPKPLLIGCLVVVVLAGAGLVGFVYYAAKNLGKIMQASLQQSEAAIFSHLPRDVTAEERQRLEAAFDAARRRAGAAGRPEEIAQEAQGLNLKMLEFVRKQNALTRQDVQELTKLLEEFATPDRRAAPPGNS